MSETWHADEPDVAAEVFARVLASLEGAAPAPETNGHAPKASRVRLTQVRSAAARTLDLYGELFQRAFETYADLAQAALQPGSDSAPETPVTLVGPPGGEAGSPLWIHNLTGSAVIDVALFVSDLTAGHGGRIPGAAATIAPGRLRADPGGSAGAALRVAIPADAAVGVYHGHVLSPTLPALALGVRLEVEP
ncbi:hypothetical protein OM076_42895 [Solirubrobacter ginsenosidimutans]|uniref:Uncharacterized protein n=1 Tax=Solirubrobacter ginsenosidimutans TaxID=490573 RepID=A0A9X3S8K3_9ACTN|nr:hypothetical protein [Solirubrobacter ginsenosidimutans]MDA0167086.1 hypothetical protein [Solirubrobacter ginsenosidimutans]